MKESVAAPAGPRVPRPENRKWSPLAAGALVVWLVFFALPGPYLGVLLDGVPGMRVPSNVLFFLPQLLFPFFGAVHRDSFMSTAAFSTPARWLLSAVLWIAVTVGFSFGAKRSRPRHLVWLAPLAVLGATLVANIALGLAGAGVELDGP